MKIESPVLRRLGPVPFWRGSTKCLDGLEEVYRRASRAAAELLGAEAAPSPERRKARRACKGGESKV